MANFDQAVNLTLLREGGLEFDKKGGVTNHGISFNFYKGICPNATTENIRDLTIPEAKEIYLKYFWNPNRYGEIVDQKLAAKVFDLSVNLGPHAANALLQSAINTLYTTFDLIPDGQIGSKTIKAINTCISPLLYNEYIAHASKYYTDLVARTPEDAKYLKGWENRLHS